MEFLGHEIEELDLIFHGNPKIGIFRLLDAQVGAPKQRSDRHLRPRRQSISGAGDPATRCRYVMKLQVFYPAHAHRLAILCGI